MTEAERAFLTRMVPHMESGKSFDDAARAVLADDERLWIAATENSETGSAIRQGLAAEVYTRIRK